MEHPADLDFYDHGTIGTLSAVTNEGADWVRDHVDTESAELWCGAIVVEPGYAHHILRGAQDDGLTISIDGERCDRLFECSVPR